MPAIIGRSPFVSRAEWQARAPRSRSTSIWPRGTTLHWEGPKMGQFSHEQCASRVRAIQKFHMDTRRWSDIAYSALVCPHGSIYEGRWLGTRSAANGTNEGNSYHYAICYLSGDGDSFTDEAKRAFNDCIAYFDNHGAGPEVKTHREWKATMCAGPDIQAWKDAGRPLPAAPPPPPPPPPPNQPPAEVPLRTRIWNNPVLRRGMTGHYVRIAQGFLMAHAADLTGRDNAFVDGNFGPATEDILRRWQARCSPPLGAVGYVDGDDWQWWVGSHPVVKRGDTGPYAAIVQGLMVAHAALPVTVDGDFGPQTEESLKGWQQRTGVLTPDGICGQHTWAWLAGA